jgi:hypothetical protein
VAAKPLKHDAVRLLLCLLEDGVAATRQNDEFLTAQFAVQLKGGAQTDRTVAITPTQQSWNLLHKSERGFQYLSAPFRSSNHPVGKCAASDNENTPECTAPGTDSADLDGKRGNRLCN